MGRERYPGRIHPAYDPMAGITPQVRQIHGHGKRARKQVQRDKVENPVRNVKEQKQPRGLLIKMYPGIKNNNDEIN